MGFMCYYRKMLPLLILAGILEASTALPYIRDIRRGTTKPAIVSWMTWMVLAGIASIAAFIEGAYASAILAMALTIESFVIVLFSLGKGHYTYTRFDAFCQAGALLGLLAWWLTDNPTAAIIGFVVTDAIGAIPTVLHAWRRPSEETFLTYALSVIANSLALYAIPAYALPDMLIPAYLLVINVLISVTLILGKRSTTTQVDSTVTARPPRAQS